MEYKNAIIKLKILKKWFKIDSSIYKAIDLALNALEQQATQNYKWIPYSEITPKDKEKSYWVCTDSGYQCECRWTNANHFWTNLTSDWHWNIFDVPQYSKVIAWMELPEPYGG